MATNGYKYEKERPYTSPQQDYLQPESRSRHHRTAPLSSEANPKAYESRPGDRGYSYRSLQPTQTEPCDFATNVYKYDKERPYTSPQQDYLQPESRSRHLRTAPLSSEANPKAYESRPGDRGYSYRSLQPTQTEPCDFGQDSYHSFPSSKTEERSRLRHSSRPSPLLSREGQSASGGSQLHQEESMSAGSSFHPPSGTRGGPSSSREPGMRASNSKRKEYTEEYIEDSIPKSPSGDECSQASVENARYSLDNPPSADHPNEDRHFAVEGERFKVFAVFDGHNGPRAAGFASNYLLKLLQQQFWKNVVNRSDHNVIAEVLTSLFEDTEKQFFESIDRYIRQKRRLQDKIPQHLTSYEAYMQYPRQVKELQDVEPKLSGGCTAVVAVVIDNVLHVANVGDSRAILVKEDAKGDLVMEQLSVDHTVENEEELKRLESLGLSPKELIKAGRLGMQENTRSIGDYSIKEGYRDVDSLRSARSPPGSAKPCVMSPRKLDSSCKYLVLMTDGVYKTIESTMEEEQADFKETFLTIFKAEFGKVHRFEDLSQHILDRIAFFSKGIYVANAQVDVRSPLAVACRKRDDMTLIVHKLTA